MRVTLPAATAAQRAARQHTASFAARGTSCASPAVGSMVPRPRTATWMPAKKGAGKRRQHGSRLSSPEPGSSLCRCGSRRLCPGRPRTPLENVRPRGFRVAARWASHAAPVAARACAGRNVRASPGHPGQTATTSRLKAARLPYLAASGSGFSTPGAAGGSGVSRDVVAGWPQYFCL